MRNVLGIAEVWVLILVLSIGCTGCIQQEESTGPSPYTDDFFRGEFSVKGEPVLNQEVEVTLTVSPIEDSPNTDILIHLPEGIELVQGDTLWEGDIKKDEVFQMRIIVKPIEEGQLEIWSEVIGESDRNWAYYIFFLTSKSEGQVSRTAFYYEPHPVERMGIRIPVVFAVKSRSILYPAVGEEVVLIFELRACEDTPNVKAHIILPEELIYINGPLEWTGDLKEDQEKTFQVTIKTTERGRFKVLSIVTYGDTEDRFAHYIFVW